MQIAFVIHVFFSNLSVDRFMQINSQRIMGNSPMMMTCTDLSIYVDIEVMMDVVMVTIILID